MTSRSHLRSILGNLPYPFAGASSREGDALGEGQRDSDAGDTLIEVLIALVVLGVAVVALLLAFGTALTGSGEHRTLTNIATAQKTVTQQIVAELQNANPPLYVACATGATYQAVTFSDLPTGYTAKISGVSLWDPADSAFDYTPSECTANLLSSNNQSAPQLISAKVSYPSGGSSVVTTVVNNPTPPTPPPAGSANNLYFYSQPGGAQGAQSLTPQPIVEIQNAAGTPVTNDLSTVVLTLMNASGNAPATGATLSGCVGSESAGYVTFRGCSVDKLGTYRLQATDSALPTGYVLQSNQFTITTGPASKILFTQQPSNSTGGTAFSPSSQPVVSVQDAGGNLVTSDASSVSLAVTTGPGSLSCNTNPVAVSGGTATFAGCSVNTKGTYTLTATDVEPTGTLTATSAQFVISTGNAAQLVFTTSPGAQTSNVTFPTASQPVVTVEDAGGNTVNSSATVTLAIGTHPTGNPSITCTGTGNGLSKNANAGVASYAGCKITNGTNSGTYTLTATSNGLSPGTSTPFTVAGTATKLVFVTQPTNTSTNTTFTTAPVVWIEDTNNDLVTSATNPVTLSIATGTGGTLSACTANPSTTSGGIATFSNCKITLSGNGGTFSLKAAATLGSAVSTTSGTFTVASAATQLVFTTQPTSSTGGVAFTAQPVVTAKDVNNDVVTSDTSAITLTITTGTGTPGAALTCTSNAPNAVAGVATFAGCSINLSGTGYTLKATQVSPALSQTSAAINITVGPAAKLAFTTQPSASSANAATWARQPALTVQDAGGNTISGATNTVSLLVGTQPNSGATLGCTTNPIVATGGLASFAGCQIVGTAGSYTLSATSPGLANATSATFSITAGAAAQLAFTTQPGGGANTGVWSTQPVVTVEDSGGNKTTSTTSVTLAIDQNAGGTLGCTHATVAAVAGVATFAGCEITGTAGTYSLNATASQLTTGVSSTFSITAGPASKVVFSTQPGGGGDGSAWATQPVVGVEDVSGNLVGGSTASITLSIKTQPGTGATLGCTNNPLSATGGVASFAGCEITGALGNYTLMAAATGLTSANSAAFAITVGNPAMLSFSTQPGNGVDGSALTTQPAVTVLDAGGNPVPTATNTITLAIGTTNPGGTLACTTNPIAANGGLATFAGCEITGKVGAYTLTATSSGLTSTTSSQLTISAGLASKLSFTTQPGGGANGAGWTQQPVVTIQDVGGNTVPSNAAVTLAIATQPGTGATLSCTTNPTNANAGVASFAGCNITGKSGAYTLSASATGFTTVNSNSVSITVGAATQLVFTTEPSAGASGSAFTTQPVIKVEDSGNNVVTNSTQTITLTPSAGTLSSCGGLKATAGVITVTGCTFAGTVGTNYSLTAQTTTAPVVSGTSANFSPNASGPANKLVITTQPSGTDASGAALATQPVVKVEDSGGNVVTSLNSGTATASIASGAGGSIAAGGTSGTFNAGVATFSGLALNGVSGTTYTLTFTGDGFTSAPSSGITVTTGAATKLVFTTQPAAGASGSALTTQPVVKVEDSGGNVVTNSTQTITLAASAGTLSSCGGLTASSGVITVTGCTFAGTVGTNYSLTAQTTTAPVVSGTSANFSPNASGPANKLVITTQPSGTDASGAALATQPVVKVEDAGGNVVTSLNSGTATASIASGAGGSIAAGGTSGTFNAGVATFSGLALNGVNGTTYTLTFTGDGFTSAASSGITVTTGAASQLVFTTQPASGTSGSALTTQPVIKVEDSGNNVVTSSTQTITLTASAGTLSSCGGLKATAGVITVTGCTFAGTVGTNYSLLAQTTTAPVVSGISANFSPTTHGTASQLVFTTQPAAGASGSALTTQPVVKVEDSGGNVVTNSTQTITLAASAGTLSSCGGLTASSGVITVTGCTFAGTVGTNYSLTAQTTTAPVVSGTSANFSPNASGPANKLVITTQPSGTDASGAALATQPVVKVEDAGGNVVTSLNSGTATASIASGAGGSIAAGGTSGTFNAGVATFSGLALNGVNGTTYTLTFTGDGFTSAASSGITVTTGAANKLVITTQPSGTDASGAALATQPVVKVEDAGGNVVTSLNSGTATASIASGAGGSIAAGGTSGTFNAGVATFSGLALNGVNGTTYTLTFTGDGFTSAASSGITVTTGAANKLVITTQPSGTDASGAALATQPVVKVEDAGGNVVTSLNSGTATASIASGAGGSIAAGGTSGTFNAGVATFSGLALNGVNGTTYTLTFTGDGFTSAASSGITVTTGAASQLVITTQPSGAASGSALTGQPVVKVEDSGGNVVTSASGTMTATINTGTGGTITAGSTTTISSGVATFSNLTMTGVAGNAYSLHFSNGTLSVNSGGFTMTFGPANKLVITTQPSGTDASGAALATQPVVKVEDAGGNVVTSLNSGTATASIASGAGGSIAAGGTSGTFNAGVATFSGLALNGVNGTTYTLTFTGDGFTSAASSGITVTTGAASQLVFTTQPASGTSGSALTTQPVIKVEDSGNNVVTSSTQTITLTASAGTLSSCGGLKATAGVITVTGCTFAGTVGTNYSLLAQTTTAPVVSGISANFSPTTHGTASQLVFTTQPAAGASGSALTTQPVVKVEDSGGNVVTNSTQTITLAASAGTLSSCGGLTASSGVITVTGCTFAGTVGTNYSLTAQTTTAPVVSGTSANFSPNASGPANKLVITTQPSGTDASGAALATQPVVVVEDSFGNVVTSLNSGTATASIASGAGGSIAAGGTSGTFNAGVATFSGLALNGVNGTTYTLTFTGDGFTSAASSGITVTTGAASQLVFTTQPASGTSGSALTTQPVIKVEDSGNNVVTSSTQTITLTASAGTLSSCGGLKATAGVITVTGCTFAGTVGTNYSLLAQTTTAPVVSGISANFSPTTHGTASQLVFTTQPAAGASGSALTTQPVVKVEDSGGNVVTNSTQTITLAASAGTLSSCGGLKATAGVITVTGCTFAGTVGTNYTLTAQTTTAPVVSGTSANFSPTTFGTAAQLVFTTQPGNGTASRTTLNPQPAVSIEDSGGNVVTTATNKITLAIGTSERTGSSLNVSTNPLAAINGVATFSGVSITHSNGFGQTTYNGWTLTATATGLGTVTSSTFTT